MEETEKLRAKVVASMSASANPNSKVNKEPQKSKEEGELSLSAVKDEEVYTSSAGQSTSTAPSPVDLNAIPPSKHTQNLEKGDVICQKAFIDYLFQSNEENKLEAMKYISRIGWILHEDESYTSPSNVEFENLHQACLYLTKIPSSSHSKGQAMCPQVVTDWIAAVAQHKAPRELSSKVKKYMLTAGWKIKEVTKNDKKSKELYISPKENTYISLVRACDQIVKDFAGSTSHQSASHGRQSEVHNQGQSQISPALPSVTRVTQTSLPNSAGQRFSMQSGIPQNFVGSSVSQSVQFASDQQQQQPQPEPQYLHHHQQQLRPQISKQKLQRSIQSSVMQSHIQQQPLQQPQNLLQPTQKVNSKAMTTNKLPLKLLIDKKCNKVLFGEANKEFIDFLFSLMSIPVGSLIKLLSKEKMVGCLGDLYGSIEELSDTHLQPNQNKHSILKTKSACLLTLVGSTGTGTKNATAPATTGEGGYVKGVVTYMVMDNLVVMPMSTISSITLLNQFKVQDVGTLEEKVVYLGMDEGLELLNASLQSKTALSDVFLSKKNKWK